MLVHNLVALKREFTGFYAKTLNCWIVKNSKLTKIGFQPLLDIVHNLPLEIFWFKFIQLFSLYRNLKFSMNKEEKNLRQHRN